MTCPDHAQRGHLPRPLMSVKWLVLFVLLVTPVHGAQLRSVQSGTATLTGTSTTAALTAIDTSRSFLVFNVAGNDNSADDVFVSGQITNSTTLTFRRNGSDASVAIAWYVAEFVAGVSVQRGSVTTSSPTTDVALTAVDLTKSFPLITVNQPGIDIAAEEFFRAELTSSTNLRMTTDLAPTGATVEWQVIEHDDASVQSGNIALGAGTSSQSALGLTPFDTGKSWLIYTADTDIGTIANIGQKLVRGQISSGTSLLFDRDNTGQSMDLTWYLVEFQDSTTVQHGTTSFGSSVSAVNTPIASVDLARSLAVGGQGMRGGKTTYASDDNPGTGWFTTELTASTTLRMTRGTTGSSAANLGWYVLQFAYDRPEIVKRAYDLDGTAIATGITIPRGKVFKFLFYIDNPGSAISDLALQDVLDPSFEYQAGSIRVDTTLVSTTVCPGGTCDEDAIFAQVDALGMVLGDGDAVSAPIDADYASFSGSTIDSGNSANANNAQLDLGSNRVWSAVITIRMR